MGWEGTRPGTSVANDHVNAGGPWSREELEREFAAYRARAAAGDWDAWADQFTEDALYVEHEYGELHGREAIRSWIKRTMIDEWPGNEMPEFPVEWYIVDDARGWIIAKIWNRMADPGDGGTYQEYNFTLLKYAGDGKWCYEEDIYNPAHFGTMIREFIDARRASRAGAEG